MISKIAGIGLTILKNIGVFILFYLIFAGAFENTGIAKKPVMEKEYYANQAKLEKLEAKEQTYNKDAEKAKKKQELADVKTKLDYNLREITNLNNDINSIKSQLK